MKKLLFVLLLVLFYCVSYGQTVTVTLKPDSTVGKDACLWMFDNGCIGYGETQTNADRNFATENVLFMKDWTWNAIGCSGGTIRSLLCFTQLDSIPSNAVILSATLRLYGTDIDVNTSYHGAPSGYYSNDVIVQEVTSPWDESTVTWNTQPTTTTTNQFNIPPSTSKYFWNYTNNSTNLVNMVQNMVSGNNYGFMLRLQTEQHYRNMVFASSDHPDSTLWPELEVTYRVCNPHFSFCVANTGEDPLQYSFTALNQSGTHLWTLGNDTISTNPSFTYSINNRFFSNLIHRIVTTEGDTCTCRVYLPYIGTIPIFPKDKDGDLEPFNAKTFVEQGKIHLGDVVEELADSEDVRAVPNPSKDNWNLYFSLPYEQEVNVIIYDLNGREVYFKREFLLEGQNKLTVESVNLIAGVYLLKIEGENINYTTKLTKE